MEVVILAGIQASCKTTYYHVYYAATHVHISKDLMRHHRNRQARQMEIIERSLQAGRSVVVDNTNPAIADRAPLIAMAKCHGVEVVGCFFEPCLEASLERNSGRTGRERVPDWVIRATLRRLQPPTYGEGFDRLYQVLVRRGGGITRRVMPADYLTHVLSCPLSGTVSLELFGTLPVVSQNSPGRLSSETLIPRRVLGQDSVG